MMVELPRAETFATIGLQEGLRVVNPIENPPPLNTDDAARAEKSRRGRGFRMAILIAALLAGSAIVAQTGYSYFVVDRFIQKTDNAYVKADFTAIAPKVSGYIKEVLVNDNDTVKAGQVLARIDDRDFQTALTQANADLEAAASAVQNVEAQINLQRSLVSQAEAALNSSRAALSFAQADADRSQKLINSGAGTQSRAEQTASVRDQADAAVKRDQANVVATRDKIPVLETQKNQSIAQRHRVEAQVTQAKLNLSYTEVTAPVDGTVGARTLRLGQLVNAGTQLMAVVPLNSIYVVANFKETQLTAIKPGQSVKISVDSFPGVIFSGRVESLSPGSGSEFSLLPADNATGNFTKIVQRIPVKISIESNELSGRLRAGMSVVPRIDTASN
jgi:membrane fusion protein (multidrug efflux system)